MPETKFPPGCPVYSRIAEQIAGRIESGGIKEGERLPAERRLSRELGVSRDTVKRAYADLEERGFIKTVQGSGSYASDLIYRVRKKEWRNYCGRPSMS